MSIKHFFSFFCLFLIHIHAQDKHFVFIIPSHNNEQWVEKNLESIFIQDYDDYHIIYCDDASTDATGQKVYECCEKHNKSHKVTYVKNEYNHKVIYNICNSVYSLCKDSDIVIILDGDDWLAPRQDILQILNDAYQDPHIWTTYGEYAALSHKRALDGMEFYPYTTCKDNTFRKSMFYFAPLRTFYAKLFKKIKMTDFFYNYAFFSTTCDMLFGIALMELAQLHTLFMPKTLYVYNDVLPTNDGRMDPSLQMYFDFYIRTRNPYTPLKELFNEDAPTTALYYFCNSSTSADSALSDIKSLSSLTPIATVIGITGRNTHLIPSLAPYGTILHHCCYHSWLLEQDAQREKTRLYEAFTSLNSDFIILTENGHGDLCYDIYTPELLSLTDCVVIGTYVRPLKKGLFKKYPHLAFMPLNSLGQTLDLRKPSTVIIKKEKLLHAIENSAWCNGSYLSLLTAIDHTYGGEYGIFI